MFGRNIFVLRNIFQHSKNFQQIKISSVLQTKYLSSTSNTLHDTTLLGKTVLGLDWAKDPRILQVHWSDQQADTRSSFPAVYLRDNCQCPKCFLASSKSRIFLMRNLDLDIKIVDAKLVEDKVQVSWSDGHSSAFPLGYLSDRSYSDAKSKLRQRLTQRSHVITWDESHTQNIHRHNFSKILENDKSLLDWLKDLECFGLTIVEDMGRDRNAIWTLSKRIGFLKLTHYGVDFVVQAKVDANNAAYTSKTLGLHVDLPYYEYMPGTQFLHCIDQFDGEGGENEFVDGFRVENIIRQNYPEEHRFLSTEKIDFVDVGVEDIAGRFSKMFQAPVFKLNSDGEVTTVRYSNEVRDSHMIGPVDKVYNYYKALKTFDRVAHDPDNRIVYKMKEGECVVFDNQRVLHARRGFSLQPGQKRWLMGGYVDWDEIRSRINVLNETLAS